MESPDLKTRRRFRISLLSLLLLTALAACAIVIFRLAPLASEAQRLRSEAGYLTIRDRSKPHAIALVTESPLVWRWKVFVPKGVSAVGLGAYVGDLPSEGTGSLSTSVSGPASKAGGEYEAVVRVYRDIDGDWQCESSLGGIGARQKMTDKQASAIRDALGWSSKGVGKHTEAGEVGKPFVLLRKEFFFDQEGSEEQGAKKSGLLMWIECKP